MLYGCQKRVLMHSMHSCAGISERLTWVQCSSAQARSHVFKKTEDGMNLGPSQLPRTGGALFADGAQVEELSAKQLEGDRKDL